MVKGCWLILLMGLFTRCHKMAYNRLPPKVKNQKWKLMTEVLYLVTSQDQEQPARWLSITTHLHYDVFVGGGIPCSSYKLNITCTMIKRHVHWWKRVDQWLDDYLYDHNHHTLSSCINPEIATQMVETRSRVFYLVHMIVQCMSLTMWINELESNMVDTIWLLVNDIIR